MLRPRFLPSCSRLPSLRVAWAACISSSILALWPSSSVLVLMRISRAWSSWGLSASVTVMVAMVKLAGPVQSWLLGALAALVSTAMSCHCSCTPSVFFRPRAGALAQPSNRFWSALTFHWDCMPPQLRRESSSSVTCKLGELTKCWLAPLQSKVLLPSSSGRSCSALMKAAELPLGAPKRVCTLAALPCGQGPCWMLCWAVNSRTSSPVLSVHRVCAWALSRPR